ncbi:ATP/GTP-binding protein [Streptomyces cinnamoneus]|uniref:ATP-binding protein n=1 Tax=Streptomyces cinnamoneus TaxID=53446 RepID=A0A918U0V0_STRCJ|nr:ATP/GTP-binding protein [Streptomyces cinnamoneus]GHC67929.1 ATP-binding protein [Streptomyces cinnamoneus]
MADISGPAAPKTQAGKAVRAGAPEGGSAAPRGLMDLRGRHEDVPAVLSYPPGAVVVVSGLPGSGKSTLLRRWSRAAADGAAPAGPGRTPATPSAVDPRAVHVACEAVMPARLPYAVYRPWARLEHFRWLRAEVRGGGPLLVHDCGSRAWMRRWLARTAGRQGRELHLILLDVGAQEALAGQAARGRWASRRVFARHRRGLDRLLHALSEGSGPRPVTPVPQPVESVPVPEAVAEAASVVLLDRTSRERVAALTFGP